MPGRICIIVAAALLLGACSDTTPIAPFEAGPSHAALVDGSTGGNPHFFFMEPLVKGSGGTGTFNPNLSPTVVVCEIDGVECADAARWTAVTGPGSERVHRGKKDGVDFYQQIWTPEEFVASVGATYRISVLLGEALLGSVDLGFYETEVELEQVLADGLVAMPFGEGVPIRFSIEHGALAAALGVTCGADCTEASVTPGETTVVVTPTKQGGVQFDETALEEGSDPINVIVAKVLLEGGQKCLPTDMEDSKGCLSVNVDRSLTLKVNTVVVGVCVDPAAKDGAQLFKVAEDANGNPTGEVKALTQRSQTFLDCSGFEVAAFGGSDHPLARLARAGLRVLQPIASVVGTSTLYAYDLGMGCDPVWDEDGDGLDDDPFSRFGWLRNVWIEGLAGDGQVATVGSTLLPPTVQILEHDHHGHGQQPAPDVNVLFTFQDPDSTVTSTVSVKSDADGIASADWTLGPKVGTYTVTITAPGTNIAGREVPTVIYTAEAVSENDLSFEDVTAKLLHRWLAEGDYTDAVGSAHGTPVGDVGFAPGRIGQAFSLDGGHIALGTGPSLGGKVNFSLEAWVNTSSGGVIINQRDATSFDGGYVLGIESNGRVFFTIHNDGAQWVLKSTAAVTDNEWHHIVAVRHGARGYLYVDGALSAEDSGGVKHLVSTIKSYIGADVRTGTNMLIGLIDHVGIFGQPLRADEVLALCRAGGGCLQ
jgi:hypothetical protein